MKKLCLLLALFCSNCSVGLDQKDRQDLNRVQEELRRLNVNLEDIKKEYGGEVKTLNETLQRIAKEMEKFNKFIEDPH